MTNVTAIKGRVNYKRGNKKKRTTTNCKVLINWFHDLYQETPRRDTPAEIFITETTDACLTAIPGVASSIPARSHTFVEIDHEIISKVILLPFADSFKKGCCQLQAKVCAQLLVNRLFKPAQEKVRLGELILQ